MKKPSVGVEKDPQGDRFLTITCPDCDQVNRYPFSSLAPDLRLECSCGVGFNISNENIQDLKENYGFTDQAESSN